MERDGLHVRGPGQCAGPVRASVSAHPQATACICEAMPVSYSALNARGNQVAHALRERGVGPEVRVGLYMERSVDFLAALLGIFKAGGVYVPLDPHYPPAYIQHILENAEPRLIITNSTLLPRLGHGCIDRWRSRPWPTGRPTNPPGILRPEHLAYVMYTSGSTGRPHGVMVTHRQLLNCLQALWARIPFDPGEVVAQKDRRRLRRFPERAARRAPARNPPGVDPR